MTLKILKAALVGLVLALSGAANATLIGTSVTVTNKLNGSIFQGPTEIVVQAGPISELFDFGSLWEINISESSLLMTCTGPFCGSQLFGEDEYLFEGLDWGGAGTLAGFTIIADNTGLNARVTSPNNTSLSVLFNSGDSVVGSFIEIDLLGSQPISVPVPPLLAILVLALSGLVAKRSSKGKANVVNSLEN